MNMTPKPVIINLGNGGAGAMGSGRLVELANKCWLTADGKTVVADGDPRARFLLGLAGDEITEEQAIELGLIDPEEDPEPETKKDTPQKNKMRQPAADK